MRRFVAGAVALLALMSLAGPAGATPTETSVSPIHERTAPGRPVLYNGWGGLRLGMTVRQTWRTGMVSHEYAHCDAGYEMRRAYRKRGYIEWREHRGGPMTVERIMIFGDRDRTVAGAGVGTTLRQLRRLYPSLTRVTGASALDDQPGRDRKDLWVASASKKWGTLNFQFAYGARPGPHAKIDRILISRKQEVYWGC